MITSTTTTAPTEKSYGRVSTKPVKRFFVEMLTRDIAVEDAILDLLDNCVDGILRNLTPKVVEDSLEADKGTPYTGFWAKIVVTGDMFEIEDNCGGIPWSEHDRAFRMGRPSPTSEQSNTNAPLSVGAYGIGMKRAIFKIGNEAIIKTQNGEDSYQVPISAGWMSDENEWDLDVQVISSKMESDGTRITITGLDGGISERFSAEAFKDDLLDKIQSHYAVIIHKGFNVKVNGTVAKPNPLLFKFATTKVTTDEIRPFMFRSNYKGVDIFLAVGLREPIPDLERTLEEQTGVQYSSDYAGWTVICNDRVVLYCNRDELTGWGTAGVPRYHTQFIAISGVIEFRGDPTRLPTTTTKRGLDFSSAIYQQVLDRMREGTRLFTDFTNQWKARGEEARTLVSPVSTINYSTLRQEVRDIAFAQVRVGLEGEQYKPRLPEPPKNATDFRISYSREKSVVIQLAEEILPEFEDLKEKDIRRKVGEASFDFAYKQLVEKA